MGESQVREPAWWRRPRTPWPPFLSGFRIWALAVFTLGVAFLVGIGVIVGEPQWWAKASGGFVSAACVAIAVFVVVHLRRPVVVPTAPELVDTGTIDGWDARLRRAGFVEIGLDQGKVTRTFLTIGAVLAVCVFLLFGGLGTVGTVLAIVALVTFSLLAAVPHLEFATGGRPAIRVDSSGIGIARWGQLVVPWQEVVAVRVHRSTQTQANVVVHVTDVFFDQYCASRPIPLRVVDYVSKMFIGAGFAIPSTTRANAETLAKWLDAEVQRRQV